MQIDKKNYQEYLQYRNTLRDFAPGYEDQFERMFFQEMVLEQLSPDEKTRYMQLLMEPRKKSNR